MKLPIHWAHVERGKVLVIDTDGIDQARPNKGQSIGPNNSPIRFTTAYMLLFCCNSVFIWLTLPWVCMFSCSPHGSCLSKCFFVNLSRYFSAVVSETSLRPRALSDLFPYTSQRNQCKVYIFRSFAATEMHSNGKCLHSNGKFHTWFFLLQSACFMKWRTWKIVVKFIHAF